MLTAHRLVGVRHPHLVLVKSVDPIVTEEIDGVRLDEVFYRASLGARLRMVVDVLSALSALHLIEGGPVVHGGVLVRSAFVDKVGRTKLAYAWERAETHAPELLLHDDAAVSIRTDVYGAGVLLWEAVTGRPLFASMSAEEIVRAQLGGRVDKALPPRRDRWASVLLPVIERALAVDPQARFSTIAEMAAALRIAVRTRLLAHEDIIEEIWPAETTPKVTSGVVPVADPEEPAEAIAALATPVTPATVPVSFPPSVPPAAAPNPFGYHEARPLPPLVAPVIAVVQKRNHAWLIACAAGLLLLIGGVSIWRFMQTKAPIAGAHADAMPPAPPAVNVVEHEENAPVSAPAASGMPEPATTTKAAHTKPRTKARTVYDPSSI